MHKGAYSEILYGIVVLSYSIIIVEKQEKKTISSGEQKEKYILKHKERQYPFVTLQVLVPFDCFYINEIL